MSGGGSVAPPLIKVLGFGFGRDATRVSASHPSITFSMTEKSAW